MGGQGARTADVNGRHRAAPKQRCMARNGDPQISPQCARCSFGFLPAARLLYDARTLRGPCAFPRSKHCCRNLSSDVLLALIPDPLTPDALTPDACPQRCHPSTMQSFLHLWRKESKSWSDRAITELDLYSIKNVRDFPLLSPTCSESLRFSISLCPSGPAWCPQASIVCACIAA